MASNSRRLQRNIERLTRKGKKDTQHDNMTLGCESQMPKANNKSVNMGNRNIAEVKTVDQKIERGGRRGREIFVAR